MTALSDLIARTELSIRQRSSSLLPSSASFLRITRASPNNVSLRKSTISQLSTVDLQVDTVDPQSAFTRLLSTKCSREDNAVAGRQNAIKLQEAACRLRLLAWTPPKVGMSMKDCARRSMVSSFEYGDIFEPQQKEVPKFSDLVAKTMPPLPNVFVDAQHRLLNCHQPSNDLDAKICGHVDKNTMMMMIKLSPMECQLLEYEHLCALLSKFGVPPKNIPKTMTTAVQKTIMMMSHVDKPHVVWPAFPRPRVTTDMTDDEQLMTIVRALEQRKAFLLQQLWTHLQIQHGGPFLKATMFWEVVRQTIQELSDQVSSRVSALTESSDKDLMMRYRMAIIATRAHHTHDKK